MSPPPAAPQPSAPGLRRPLWLGQVANDSLVLVSGFGACALALPEGRRPALVVGLLGALAVTAALITRWRIVGSVAVLLVTLTPLMAGALEDDAAAPGRLALAAALILALVVGLDGIERRDPRGPLPVALHATSPARRWAPPLVALASCGLIGAVSAASVTPSVAFVVVGLLASVGAVLVATRVH
jgi:hypothetical protein